MEKVIDFLKKYKTAILLIGATVFIIFLLSLFISSPYSALFKRHQTEDKKVIDNLNKENKILQLERKELRDSINILHNLAIQTKEKDTIYQNQIKYIKTKQDEEITHIRNLTLDSQYIVFSSYIEEYSKTGFNQNIK